MDTPTFSAKLAALHADRSAAIKRLAKVSAPLNAQIHARDIDIDALKQEFMSELTGLKAGDKVRMCGPETVRVTRLIHYHSFPDTALVPTLETIGVHGVMLKKDGTPSKRSFECCFRGVTRLP